MSDVRLFFTPPEHSRPAAVLFLSGSGTNAERLLEAEAAGKTGYRIAGLVTDAPERSRAAALAAHFAKPLVALAIRDFYHRHGESRVSLLTERGRAVRELWTAELRRMIAPLRPDFGILAGFVPLSNITGDFPCLNVHPGDLTVVDAAGQRLLVGLHTVPIEKAIAEGFDTLRSSVILARSYSGSGATEMDSGPLLGISPELRIDRAGRSAAAWRQLRDARVKPREADALAELAARHQERLKVAGDWVVFPPAVDDFARGCFGYRDAQLFWRAAPGAPWQAIRTIEYGAGGARRLLH